MRKQIAAVAFATTMALGCSGEQAPAPTPSATATAETYGPAQPEVTVNPETFRGRIETVERWISYANKIAEGTNNEEAKAIVSYLRGAAVATLIGPNQFAVVKNPDLTGLPTIIPFEESDEAISPGSTEQFQRGGYFDPAANLITGLNGRLSDTFQGLMLLHEGKHARDYNAQRYDFNNPRIFAAKELETYEFEQSLVDQLGGEAYQNLVEEYSGGIARELQVKNGRLTGIPRQNKVAEMSQIFGESKSVNEDAVRDGHVWVRSTFRAIEEHHSEDADNLKMQFMLSLYEKDFQRAGIR